MPEIIGCKGIINGIFFGLIDFASPALESPRFAIKKMAQVHGTNLAHRLDFYADGWAGLGFLPERFNRDERRDVFYHADSLIVCVEGEITNKSSLAVHSPHVSAKDAGLQLPELVYHAFRKRGLDLFAELDGFYRIAIWDIVRKSLFISGDRNGFWPLYFAREQSRFLWGSEVKFILRSLRRKPHVNFQAVHDFLRFGYIFDGSTFLKDIEQITAGHVLHIEQGDFQILNPLSSAPAIATHYSVEDAADTLKNAAISGVKSLSGDKQTGILLSGGIDARLLAAASSRLHSDTVCLSSGDNNSIDVQIARKVAEKCGYEHQCFSSDSLQYIENFKRTIWLADGLLNGVHNQPLDLLPFLKDNPLTVLDGLQPLRGPYYLFESKLWSRRKWNEQQKMWLAGRLFPHGFDEMETTSNFPQLQNQAEEYHLFSASERLRSICATWDFEKENAEETIAPLYRTLNHQFFKSRISGLLRHFVPMYSPFYLFLYTELVRSFPKIWQSADRLILRKIISEINPALTKIPWQATLLPLDKNPWVEYGSRGLHFMKQHFTENFQRRNLLPRRPGSTDFSKNYFRSPVFRQFVLSTVKMDTPFSFLPKEKAEKLLQRLLPGDRKFEELISRLMTVNLWYQYFIKGESPDLENFDNSKMEQHFIMASQ